MTNEEMKKALAQGGVAEAEIEKVSEKFDAEKITEIVEEASNPREAFENLHAFYPELEVEKLEEQMNFVQDQLEAATKGQTEKEPVELTENELEMVSGGGIGDWFKSNWKKVAIGAAIVVGAALICTGVGAAIGAAVASSAVASSASALLATTAAVGITDLTISAASAALVVGAGTATGALIGACVGTAVGGAVTGALAGTGVL